MLFSLPSPFRLPTHTHTAHPHLPTGYKILAQARQQLASAGVDHHTGLHKPEVQEPPPLTPNTGTQQPADVFKNGKGKIEKQERGREGGVWGGRECTCLLGMKDSDLSSFRLCFPLHPSLPPPSLLPPSSLPPPSDEVEMRDRLSSVTSVVSLEEQVEFLQEKLEMLQSQCSGSE